MNGSRRALPVLDARSSLRADGSRELVVPADVRGRFATLRKVAFVLLMAVYLLLPWIRVGGHPAVFLDVARREFFLLGAVFNAQDVAMTVFLLTGGAFGLVVVTSLLGRAWCGWTCPQTVFLEGLYRPIERLIEGPREKALRRKAGPWTFARVGRKLLLHGAWIAVSLGLSHAFVAYFVSVPSLLAFVREPPLRHPGTFALVTLLAGTLYLEFAWFREQFCVVMCPYGRLQSVLLDRDSLVVGYDERRGEPRGKANATSGDCVDCGRCVVVCPTGIDIRNGLQMDCLACTACIDACDAIMDRLHRPRGLVRYDSQAGLAGEPRRFVRPRLLAYVALGMLGLAATSFAMERRRDFDATLLRASQAPYTLDEGQVRNAFHLHLVNKRSELTTFELRVTGPADSVVLLPLPQVELRPLQSADVPFFVSIDRAHYRGESPVRLLVQPVGARGVELQATFLGPTP